MNDQPTYAQHLIQSQVKEILDRAAEQMRRIHPLDWHDARQFARLACAEVLTAILDDADFYREDAVTTRRIARLRDQLNPAITNPGGGPR